MLAAPYVPSDIVPLVDGSAHFRFGVLESKKHCLAEIEPPEAGGHSERLLPYLRTAEQGKPVVVYLGDFAESAHGYLRIMKNGAIFRLPHGWLFNYGFQINVSARRTGIYHLFIFFSNLSIYACFNSSAVIP